MTCAMLERKKRWPQVNPKECTPGEQAVGLVRVMGHDHREMFRLTNCLDIDDFSHIAYLFSFLEIGGILEELDECQQMLRKAGIESGNEKALINKRYNPSFKPLFQARSPHTASIPGFWFDALLSHRQVSC